MIYLCGRLPCVLLVVITDSPFKFSVLRGYCSFVFLLRAKIKFIIEPHITINNHHIFFLTYLSWDKLESGKVSVVRVVLLNKVTTLSLMTMTMVRMVAMVRMVSRACCREVKIPNQYGGVILWCLFM